MPFDLKLVNGDISIDPFDILLNTQGLEAVGQRLLISLNTFKGEYFLNTEFGTPWYQTVLRKGISKNLIDTQLRRVITETKGVLQLIEYQSTINNSTRSIDIRFKARADEGIVDAIITTGGGAPVLCIYNPPTGNNIVFLAPLTPGVPPSPAAADIDFNC